MDNSDNRYVDAYGHDIYEMSEYGIHLKKKPVKTYAQYICERMDKNPTDSNIQSFLSVMGYVVPTDTIRYDYVVAAVLAHKIYFESWDSKNKCVSVSLMPDIERALTMYHNDVRIKGNVRN